MKSSSGNIKCSIHQPNFLPWLGYFYKIAQSDIFIFLDDVPLSKGSYTLRVKMHDFITESDGSWIGIPIQKQKLGTLINEVSTSMELDWPEKMRKQIQGIYKDAPNYKSASKLLEDIFSRIVPGSRLSEVNELLIKGISAYLGIQTTFRRSSDLKVASSRQEKLIDLLLCVNGSTYISGMGGLKYLSEKPFKEEGINLVYSDFATDVKGKIPHDFINKSVISYLFHYSVEEINTLFKSNV